MAYQTGTATDCNDLLDKFRLFAIAQGWTANRWVTAGNGRELCLQKGSAYFNFRSLQNEAMNPFNGSNSGAGMYGIVLNGSDGYAGGSPWDRQPGYPVRSAGTLGSADQGHVWCPVHDLNTGPFPAYHFFGVNSGQALYCEWEVSTGTFQRFGIGSLDLFNPAAGGGGRFCYATGGAIPLTGNQRWRERDIDKASYMMECVPFRRASLASHNGSYGAGRTTAGSMVRASFSSFDNWACSGRDASQQPYAWVCQGGGNHDRMLREFSPAPLNGTAVLVPNIVSLNINNEFLAPIGQMPGLRFMDMSNYLPGDEFTLGTDTWKVFPWYAKGGLSYQRGIAFLKEA